jgi:hypothetical protein
MLKVPVVALRFTVMFIVELPFPPVIEDGLKPIEVPLLCPDADNEIDEILPCMTAVVILEEPEELLEMLSDVGFAEMLKFDGAAVTVRVTVVVATVVFVSEPVPVTVTVNVPVAAVDVAVKVSSELPDGPIGLVPMPTVTPEGRPDTDNEIDELYPPNGVLVTVEVPFVPCTIESGVPESENPEVGTAPVSAASSPAFGLPQPVTRSYPLTAE